MGRHEIGKGKRKEGDSVADNSHSDSNEKQLKTCVLRKIKRANYPCSLAGGRIVMGQGQSDFHTQNHQCHTG